MSVLDKLHSLGETLPAPPAPGGNYVPWRRVGPLLYLAGTISIREGVVTTGKVGVDRTVEEGYLAARLCALNHLATIQEALGSLDHVRQIVTLNGYVNAAPDFPDPPLVINGASDLLVALYGDAGRHARAAIGVATLPKCALVEVQMTVEVKEGF
jgi:enamine deaminase RidA (YjgF/YER057c/UK114 family)